MRINMRGHGVVKGKFDAVKIKMLTKSNLRILLPAALALQNIQSNFCELDRRIFCPARCLVEPLMLFPACQGQPGLRR